MSRTTLLAVLSLGFAPAPFPKSDPSSVDLKTLQGEWGLVSLNQQGDADEVEPGKDIMKFAGLRAGYLGKGGRRYTIALDASATPKRIDFKHLDGDDHKKGIYRLDTLTVCIERSGGPSFRPADFHPRSGVAVIVLKRKKP